jgi:hypothetical protein
MQILGDRSFVELPGEKTHELPPLLIRGVTDGTPTDQVIELANGIIEDEDLIPGLPADDWACGADVERRKMDLAVNLAEQYLGMLNEWKWGDSILEWIRQCEITFESRIDLRALLRPDIWPHASRSSFVTLLSDKDVKAPGVAFTNAVGLRLTFRQPPPISCFSDQFLFYLNASVANSAYSRWAAMSPDPVSALPPERFHFQVVKM